MDTPDPSRYILLELRGLAPTCSKRAEKRGVGSCRHGSGKSLIETLQSIDQLVLNDVEPTDEKYVFVVLSTVLFTSMGRVSSISKISKRYLMLNQVSIFCLKSAPEASY